MPAIPARIYDAIVAEAEKYGGVGSGALYIQHGEEPYCVLGMVHAAGIWIDPYGGWADMMHSILGENPDHSQWVDYCDFDQAVCAIQDARDYAGRVPVLDVFKATGITRAEEPDHAS